MVTHAPPEFFEWAGPLSISVNQMSRLGKVILPLKVMIQNRRQDKLSITVDGSSFHLIGSSHFAKMQDERDMKYMKWIPDRYG